MANASSILYTGLPLTHLSVPTNTALDVILGLIDTAVGSGSGSSPDYSLYSLACVTQTDGTSHPTNTQNFAEGISKILCDFKTAYNTFTGSTYVTDSAAFTNSINALQSPGLTYSNFSITNTDNVTAVWNKSFTGFTNIINSINPSSANWSSLGASGINTIVSAFNTLIAYEVTQNTTISGKQASLGVFDTSTIGGVTGQAPIAAINQIITAVASSPTYASGSVTWGCVAAGGTLTTDINNIVIKTNYLSSNYLSDTGTGLTKTSVGSCMGYRASIDTTWPGLYKVCVDSIDAGAGGQDFLINKIESTDSTVTITNDSHNKINLSVPASANAGKVLVNSSGTPDYLVNKIPGLSGTWGLALSISVVSDQLQIIPQVANLILFAQNFMTTVSQDPDLTAQLCALLSTCNSCNCPGATEFTVTPSIS